MLTSRGRAGVLLTGVIVNSVRIPLLVGIAAALCAIRLRSGARIGVCDIICEILRWAQR